MPGGLLADLYELNMAAGYLRRSMTGPATFSLFMRRLPPGRGFLSRPGLKIACAFLEGFSFTAEDLDYLHRSPGYDDEALRGVRRPAVHRGRARGPEGRVVFAGEPLLEVTAPIAEAQLAETVLLNHLTFQTNVAAKAARCVLAAAARSRPTSRSAAPRASRRACRWPAPRPSRASRPPATSRPPAGTG